MIKAFLALIIMLVLFDEGFRHGVGTATTIDFIYRIGASFSASLQDSVFSH
jgi:hypothetical protein